MGLCSLLVIYLGPNYGGDNQDNGDISLSKDPMHVLLHSVPPTLQQATTDQHLHWGLDTHRSVWVSLLWGHCSFLLGPGAYEVLFVPSKSLFPLSWVSSGSSVVELIATSSKRAYAIPRSASPRAPESAAVHSWTIPPQEKLKQFCLSLCGSVGPGAHKVFLSPLSISGGCGV